MFRCASLQSGLILKRLLQFLSTVVLASSLAIPLAQAAGPAKKPVLKKHTHSVHVAKRVATPRRVAARLVPHVRKNGSKVKVVASARRRSIVRVAYTPAPQSFGELDGLHAKAGPLDLKSGVALVMDQDTHEVLFSKNDRAVLPIASLSKLMAGLVISESGLPMDQMITVTQDDVDTIKHSRSRLRVGTVLSRGEMLHLALMASENRATHALARTYPGGVPAFVAVMNAKAKMIGMTETHYVEPTGLSFHNQSSAHDLALLANVAYQVPLLREITTSHGMDVDMGRSVVAFHNTDVLVRNPGWDIGLSKTGFINEAGHCLLMQAKVAGRNLIMVFLDSAGSLSRFADAERVR
ncbi:MAG: serine hydrolase, partial [Rhodoferax sp.]